MDGTAPREEKAPPPTGGSASSADVEQQPAPPLSVDVKVESGGEEDDEQVERFFALLANIRAMYGAAFAGGGESRAAGRGRKRARGAEPPWRPAFRMEDFDDELRAGKKVEGTGGAKLLAGTSTVAVADADEDDGEVVETSGCPVAARG
ncbi:hypothetical protein EJB05_35182, partial [Eragrostis curvula]